MHAKNKKNKMEVKIGDVVLNETDINELLKETMREMGHTSYIDFDGKEKNL